VTGVLGILFASNPTIRTILAPGISPAGNVPFKVQPQTQGGVAQSVVCHFTAGEWMKFLSSMVVIGIIAWATIQFDNRWIRLLFVPVAVIVGLAVFTFTGNSDQVYEVWPLTVGLALGVYFLPWRKWLQKDKDKLFGKAKTREPD
jgi:hypothetical protein